MKINLFWFRRDLRLDDNAAFDFALSAGNVLPFFIFDPSILQSLETKDKRVNFIYQQVLHLHQQLAAQNRAMLIFYGKPKDVFSQLFTQFDIANVFTNRDYEPAARARDTAIKKLATEYGVKFCRYKDHVIFEAGEILKNNQQPYTVFTPYSRKWMTQYLQKPPISYQSETKISAILASTEIPKKLQVIPSLEAMGFNSTENVVKMDVPDDEVIRHYDQNRDFPAQNGSSYIGPHLRFGTLSIRKMATLGMDMNSTWLRQLIWRDFFSQILFYFPHTATQSFRPAYDAIPWRDAEKEFEKWCQGKTGFALVDAGMRELNQTGYMHNRVRMVCANFLTKLLLIDWRLGEAYFAQKLLDYDMSNNVGGWQWACGSGCDAAPYFRIFNPQLQIEKFDPKLRYIKTWIPEYGTEHYQAPMVDYKAARERALLIYKAALKP